MTVTSITITDDAKAKTLLGSDTDYGTCWGDADAAGVYASVYAGQDKVGSTFHIYRGTVNFDTSVIPSGATISAAKLRMYADAVLADTAFTVVVMNGQPTYPHDPVVVGDYNKANYSGDGGSLASGSMSAGIYNDIVLNATGVGWINIGPGAVTKFCLRSDLDIAGTSPLSVENQYAAFAGPLTNGPILEITWTGPTITVVTDSTLGTAMDTPLSTDYSSVRNTVTGQDLIQSYPRIGQINSGGQYRIYRYYALFDTSAIPVGATILSAKLSIYCYLIQQDLTDYRLKVQNGQPTYPHNPVVDGDFDRTQYSEDGGQSVLASAMIAGYVDIVLNPTGKGWINAGGITKLEVLSSADIDGIAPDGSEWVACYGPTAGSNPPTMTIIWEAPAPPSTVGSRAQSVNKGRSASMNRGGAVNN